MTPRRCLQVSVVLWLSTPIAWQFSNLAALAVGAVSFGFYVASMRP